MANDWFMAWSLRHMERFGMSERADEKLVATFAASFESEHITESEADEASRWCAASGTVRYKSQHLASLLQRIKLQRSQRRTETQGVSEGCRQCDYCGFVLVPHPSDWTDGSWNGRYTAFVACDCGLGHAKGQTQIPNERGARQPVMTLRRYVGVHPDWDAELQRVREAKSEYARLRRPRPQTWANIEVQTEEDAA